MYSPSQKMFFENNNFIDNKISVKNVKVIC